MLTPREKSPLPEKMFPEDDQTHDAASSRTASPTHYQPAIPTHIPLTFTAPDLETRVSRGVDAACVQLLLHVPQLVVVLTLTHRQVHEGQDLATQLQAPL